MCKIISKFNQLLLFNNNNNNGNMILTNHIVKCQIALKQKLQNEKLKKKQIIIILQFNHHRNSAFSYFTILIRCE